MTIGNVIERLLRNYDRNKKDTGKTKPISDALYQTWKWASQYEKPRKVDK